jgi:hypothetical protein
MINILSKIVLIGFVAIHCVDATFSDTVNRESRIVDLGKQLQSTKKPHSPQGSMKQFDDAVQITKLPCAQGYPRPRELVQATCRVVGWLGTYHVSGRPRPFDIGQKLAWGSIRYADSVSIWHAIRLLKHCSPEWYLKSYSLPEGKVVSRCKHFLELHLTIWKRISQAIDPAWNESDRPARFDPLKYVKEQTFFNGMSLDEIKDPVRRAEAKKAYQAYITSLQKYNQQYSYRQIRKSYKKFLIKRLRRIQTLLPTKKDRKRILSEYIQKYENKQDVQKELIDAVFTPVNSDPKRPRQKAKPSRVPQKSSSAIPKPALPKKTADPRKEKN